MMEIFIRVTEQEINGDHMFVVSIRMRDHVSLRTETKPIKTRYRVNACLMAIENAIDDVLKLPELSWPRIVTVVLSDWKAVGYIYGNEDCLEEKPLRIGMSIHEKLQNPTIDVKFQSFNTRAYAGYYNMDEVQSIGELMEEDAASLAIPLQHIFSKRSRNERQERIGNFRDKETQEYSDNGNVYPNSDNENIDAEWD